MAAHTTHSYINGTSALKVDDALQGLRIVQGGRAQRSNRASRAAHDDRYFADDLSIAFAASGLSDMAASLREAPSARARKAVSPLASFASAAAVFAVALFFVLL